MKKSIVAVSLACFAAGALAQSFVVHELEDAHRSADDALRHLAEANHNHHDQFGGHEGKATELLNQARHEIEEADRFFREHHH